MSFDLDGGSLMTAQELIEDKAAFLAAAPVLSRERSLGFDYRPENPADIWDTDNVPGQEDDFLVFRTSGLLTRSNKVMLR